MIRAEEGHNLFRGASEVAKNARVVAFVFDLIAASLVILPFVGSSKVGQAWQPFVALLLVLGSQVAADYAVRVSRFAERCRRLTVRAFAFQEDLAPAELGSLRADKPVLSDGAVRRLPELPLGKYYDPTQPPGDGRLRECYAHSAFFSWQLLRAFAYAQLAVSAVLILGTLGIMVGLVNNPPASATSANVIDALCSIALAVLGSKSLRNGLDSLNTSKAIRSVADTLLKAPAEPILGEMIALYDREISGSVYIPTWLYRIRGGKLQADWNIVRAALEPTLAVKA